MKYELVGMNKDSMLVTDSNGKSYTVAVDALNRDFRKYVANTEVDKKARVSSINELELSKAKKALGIATKEKKD